MIRHLCSVCDATSKRDPTGTEKIRSLTRQDAAARLGRVSNQLQTAIVKHDLLALGPQSPSHYSDSHLRLVALSKWLAAMMGVNFHHFLVPAIGKAWELGTIRARGEVKRDATPKDASAHYLAWVRSELDGILAAGVQLVSRDAVDLRGGSPVAAYRRLRVELMKIRPRLEALVNTSIVKAYNAAKLATYTEVGVRRVGVIPESLRAVLVGDTGWTEEARAAALEARKAGKAPPRQGPAIQKRLAAKGLNNVWVMNAGRGLLIAGFHGEGETSEIEKTKLVETLHREGYETGAFGMHARSGMAPLFSLAFKIPVRVGDADPLAPYRAMARRRRGVGTMVSVRTAEDDLVCVDCEDAADAGPYTVPEAYALFPMHVNCRCSFVPYDEDEEDFEEDSAADPVRLEFLNWGALLDTMDTGWTEEAREAALAARRANAKGPSIESHPGGASMIGYTSYPHDPNPAAHEGLKRDAATLRSNNKYDEAIKSKLNDLQLVGLFRYIKDDDFAQNVNKPLREGTANLPGRERVREAADVISSALAQLPKYTSGDVYRTIQIKGGRADKLFKENSVVEFKAFTSTTKNRGLAEGISAFGELSGGKAVNNKTVFTLKNAGGVDVSGISPYDHEQVLIDKGSHFHIDSVKKREGGGWSITATRVSGAKDADPLAPYRAMARRQQVNLGGLTDLIDTGWTEEAREAALAARRAAAHAAGAVSAGAMRVGARAASRWVSTNAKAREALGKVLTESNVKSAVSLGIKSALYHLGNLDDPAMNVIEPFIEHHVHNIETTLQVTKGRAHDMMMAGVRKLMDARNK